MSMNLHGRINKAELNDTERFEFLTGDVRRLVLRMDELHPSKNNDSHYLFLIWVDEEDHAEALKKIRENIRRADLDRDWKTHILPTTGDGLIIISTWCR